ncbi:MAG: class I SAM-dependent methyltransferase [Deltaproteobacteria bacterium]|nr:class I SAM-dependent methyltransferase [Deltaproteobacteria bacterium]
MTGRGSTSYWRKVRYRGPDHPVVGAYVRPKLDVIEEVLPLRGLDVLDVGCGPGLFSKHIAARGANVVGIDASAAMIERALREGVRAEVGDAENLRFGDGEFDVAFEANVLHHAADPLKVVREMARVSRMAVAIVEPNRLNPVMFWFSLLVGAERGGLRSSRRNLVRQLAAAGLHVELFETTGMISQNNTPEFLVPALRRFDFNFPLGEYHVAVALKRGAAK